MSIDALFRQANTLQLAGDFAGAERRYRALVKLKPLWAHHNLGVLYFKTGREAEAEAELRSALAIDPNLAAAKHTLGMLLLRLGRYAEGWPLYEHRRANPAAKLTRPNLAYPEWRGEDLAGKHLVVVREQGFGDQIMFARFLPALAARAGKVSFVCSPNLVRLFGGLGVDLVPASEAPPAADGDYWVPDCSLGLRLGVTLETLAAKPYLGPVPPGSGGGVGVIAKGSPTHTNDRNRSLSPKLAARLLGLGRDLMPEATGAKDFQDTAEIIAGLDLVISVDTATAHLAAAMGKPTWVLVPAVETDWRWLKGREDSPWYATARLFREPGPGRWAEVVAAVEHALAARAG